MWRWLVMLSNKLEKKMPIRPENRDRYPKDWKEIRKRILARAGDKCEDCGAPNRRWIKRKLTDKAIWVETRPYDIFTWPRPQNPPDVIWAEPIKVVLTIAHLDHTPENCNHDNLRAWCQLCHNRYDAPERAKNRKLRAGAARSARVLARLRAGTP